jgi:hypothetical protein
MRKINLIICKTLDPPSDQPNLTCSSQMSRKARKALSKVSQDFFLLITLFFCRVRMFWFMFCSRLIKRGEFLFVLLIQAQSNWRDMIDLQRASEPGCRLFWSIQRTESSRESCQRPAWRSNMPASRTLPINVLLSHCFVHFNGIFFRFV